MAILKPPELDKNAPIVDPDTGRVTPYMQRLWQNIVFNIADAVGVDIAGKVDKRVTNTWSPATGTGSQATFVTYTAPVISNPPTQAEVQAIADHVQVLSQHMKTVIDALIVSDVFGL